MLNRSNVLGTPDERATAQRLQRVQDGMKVVDASGDNVGTVAFVKLGEWAADADPSENDRRSPAVVAAPGSTMGDTSGKPIVAMPVGPVGDEFGDDVSDAVRSRLLQKGYIRVDGGFFFGKDRYVFADQLANVSDGVVKLNVNKDELVI